jgi:hypothetical protein
MNSSRHPEIQLFLAKQLAERTLSWRAVLGVWVMALSSLGSVVYAQCHPEPSTDKTHYIVGYGSLMQDASRHRTAPDAGPAMPVRVDGLERGFFAQGNPIGFSTTYLGVKPNADQNIVAALYALPNIEEVAATDKRERGYCRVEISPSRITLLNNQVLPTDAQYWIYINEPARIATASQRFPLVQSYIDIFISGCRELSGRTVGYAEDFVEQCIKTTSGWSEHWVNDRIYPRRPFIYQPQAGFIDRYLHEYVPQFQFMRIE